MLKTESGKNRIGKNPYLLLERKARTTGRFAPIPKSRPCYFIRSGVEFHEKRVTTQINLWKEKSRSKGVWKPQGKETRQREGTEQGKLAKG